MVRNATSRLSNIPANVTVQGKDSAIVRRYTYSSLDQNHFRRQFTQYRVALAWNCYHVPAQRVISPQRQVCSFFGGYDTAATGQNSKLWSLVRLRRHLDRRRQTHYFSVEVVWVILVRVAINHDKIAPTNEG
jgi:hypothetical protein